ncbi:hypothetical protein L0222_08025 [bacterium]|nr:hypothetical protein [bacterium]MCI0606494.1 hypothetical protein [bacterium]
MSLVIEFYIGRLKLDVINDAYLVEVSFVDNPPYQNKLKDLPDWTLSSKNAIWFVQEDQPITTRAKHGDTIKEDLTLSFLH